MAEEKLVIRGGLTQSHAKANSKAQRLCESLG
jgi:hypothetical protein